MGQPAHELTRGRDRVIFLLTLVAVVVTAALLGYLLGQYAFSRWVGLPPQPAPRLAELGEPPPRVVAPSAASTPLASAPPASPAPSVRAEPPAGRAPSRVLKPPAVSAQISVPGAPSASTPSAAPAPSVTPAPSGVGARSAPAGGPPAAAAAQEEAQARAEGYFVQVAAFSQLALAERALQQLAGQGYDARVVTTRGPDGRELYYKVWVGPFGRREEAVAARERLRAQWPNAWIP